MFEFVFYIFFLVKIKNNFGKTCYEPIDSSRIFELWYQLQHFAFFVLVSLIIFNNS